MSDLLNEFKVARKNLEDFCTVNIIPLRPKDGDKLILFLLDLATRFKLADSQVSAAGQYKESPWTGGHSIHEAALKAAECKNEERRIAIVELAALCEFNGWTFGPGKMDKLRELAKA